jgi:integrase
MAWKGLGKPKMVELRMPGAGLPRDTLRVSLETRDRQLGEARKAMFRDLYARLQFDLLRARQEGQFTTEALHRAYREGEATLKALRHGHEGRLLAPLVQAWQRGYVKVARRQVFNQVNRFLAQHGGAKATTACLTPANIEAFLASLPSGQGRHNKKPSPVRPRPLAGMKPTSGATRNRYRAAISGFCTWLVKHGHLDAHPIAHKRVEKFAESDPRMPAPFTPDDTRRYMAVVTRERPDLRPVFQLLLHTGADLGEILARQTWHAELGRAVPRMRYKRSKTRTPERSVPIPADVAAELRAHVAFHHLANEDPLFGMVTRKHIESLHALAAAEIGRPSLTIKDLRHVAAIAWVEAGVRIDRVSQLLGHSTLSQTMVYITFAPDTAEEADIARLGAAQLHGLGCVTPITDRRTESRRVREASPKFVVREA